MQISENVIDAGSSTTLTPDKNVVIRQALADFTTTREGAKSPAEKADKALIDFKAEFEKLEQLRPRHIYNEQHRPDYMAFDISGEIESSQKLLNAYRVLAKGKQPDAEGTAMPSFAVFGADRVLIEHIPDVVGASGNTNRNPSGILWAQFIQSGDEITSSFRHLHDTFRQNDITHADMEAYSRQLPAQTPSEVPEGTASSFAVSTASQDRRHPLPRSIAPGQIAAQRDSGQDLS